MENARRSDGWASAPPEARVADLHAAFLDDEVAVVLAGIGGNHANQLLPLLDFDLVAAHPKVFQGFSDITVLHWAFLRHAGLGGFYGPMLVDGARRVPGRPPESDRSLRAAWFGDEPLRFEPAAAWTDEFLDWEQQLDLTRARTLHAGEGWVALRGGRAEGWLLGGCLETICWHLKGSSAWVEPGGAILFLETSEEAPSPAQVDAYLTDLEQLGVFDRAAALVVGRAVRLRRGADEAAPRGRRRAHRGGRHPRARERRQRPHRPDVDAPARLSGRSWMSTRCASRPSSRRRARGRTD